MFTIAVASACSGYNGKFGAKSRNLPSLGLYTVFRRTTWYSWPELVQGYKPRQFYAINTRA